VQREAVLAPYEGRYRILILCRMDDASTEAANSLLKTLEEPPAQVVLMLTAVDMEALPPTVVSRCQRIDLRPVPTRTIEEALVQAGVESERARLLAQLSAGRVGWALNASRDKTILGQRQEDIDQLLELLPAGHVQRLGFAHRASSDPVAARGLVEEWTVWWRDLFLMRSMGEKHVVNTDRLGSLRAQTERFTLSQIWRTLGALEATAEHLERNVNTRLALEDLVLKLPRMRELQP
jgi:DNA polymerase-3 subunit delta'